MKKIVRIGKIRPEWTQKGFDIFCKVILEDGRLSMSGVMGPLASGNARGGCGQIDMEFKHRDMEDNDKRYSGLIKASNIEFAPGWDKDKWFDFLDIWKEWHLNDMQAGCEHQRELEWTYEDHHNKETFKGDPCPVCGYEIGSAWLRKDVPQNVIEWLEALPDTDKQPAWV
jgi:hypothetical protein